jgi:hypothetical protein
MTRRGGGEGECNSQLAQSRPNRTHGHQHQCMYSGLAGEPVSRRENVVGGGGGGHSNITS